MVDGVNYSVGAELGAPVSEPRALHNPAGGDSSTYQIFERGGITISPSWTPSFPASAKAWWIGGQSHPALRALGAKWKEDPFLLVANPSRAAAGYAASGYHDRRWPTTLFSDGGPAYKAGGPTDVRAAIWNRWQAMGGLTGADSLSYPLDDEANGAQRFQNGNLAVDGSNATPTAYLLGEPFSHEKDALYDRWQSVAATGPAAAATDTVYDAANGGGYVTGNDLGGSARGSLVAKSGSGAAHLVSGDTHAYWSGADGAAGFLRWPTSERTAVAGGTVQAFEGGNVYQRPGLQPFAVDGGPSSPFLSTYLALGGPAGALGFPVEDAPDPGNPVYASARRQRFQNGSITATSGTIAVPEYDNPIDPHTGFGISGKTANSVSLGWHDSGSPFTFVSRQVDENGQWTRIATMARPGPPPSPTTPRCPARSTATWSPRPTTPRAARSATPASTRSRPARTCPCPARWA